MKGFRADVVATSIGDGDFVRRYAKAIRDQGLENRVRLIVIADRKTPRTLYEACAACEDVEVVCPSLDEQQRLMEALGEPEFVPFDSENRRNVGFLLSWADATGDFVVSVDDDNFPADELFFAEHAVVAAEAAEHDVVETTSGWFNPCDLLEVSPVPVFVRGFPYRHRIPTQTSRSRRTQRIAINAGLWLGSPDVDAITHLAVAPTASANGGGGVVLGPGTWSPINTQNTAVRRDALAAFYTVRMGYPLNGHPIARFGDILGGVFAQACAKHLGDGIRFGTPHVRHERNDHALLRDLRDELHAIVVFEELADELRACRLDGSTYTETYACLAEVVDETADRLRADELRDELPGFLRHLADVMRTWLAVLERAGDPSLARLLPA